MSELISGKEALIALANGGEVQHFNKKMAALGIVKDSERGECGALCADDFLMEDGIWAFRLKPRTITLNIEIEKPKEIVLCGITGAVGLVYGNVAKAKEVQAALREVFK